MFIKFDDIDCFLCNYYPCVLFESLSHVINQESNVYSWNFGKIYLFYYLKFWNLPHFTREISKFQKSVLGKFIPNFPLKHVITSTYFTENSVSFNILDKLSVILHAIIYNIDYIIFRTLPTIYRSNSPDVFLGKVSWKYAKKL